MDGGEPYKGVTLDPQGDLFGTAGVGGMYVGPCIDTGCGVVFKLTNKNGTWTQRVIHSFTGGDDGYGPGSGVTIDKRGNIYGTTPTGGANGYGVVYQLKPDGGGKWTEKLIHTFTGGLDGLGGSAGRLIVDAAEYLRRVYSGRRERSRQYIRTHSGAKRCMEPDHTVQFRRRARFGIPLWRRGFGRVG